MKFKVVGIDPGKSGGIVSLTQIQDESVETFITTMPTADILPKFFKQLFKIEKGVKTYVFIEDVHSMPTDGVVSAHSFGRHLGFLDGLLSFYSYRIRITRIYPRTWQLSYGLKREKQEGKYLFKKRLLFLARDWEEKMARNNQRNSIGEQNSHSSKLTLKTCDAYLIALYGFNQIKDKQNA